MGWGVEDTLLAWSSYHGGDETWFWVLEGIPLFRAMDPVRALAEGDVGRFGV